MTDQNSEGFGNIPHPSATFGTVPQDSEGFGKIPQGAETFRTVRNSAERTDQHTLTVREVARHFEHAGVPRTERSIINWCRLNRHGVARLDAFFDENEGRYYITEQSVNRAVEEERAKQPAASEQPSAEKELPHRAETSFRRDASGNEEVRQLERQNRDLEIATRAKDFYIERLEKERGGYVDQLVGMSRYVGELETQVIQFGGVPRGDRTLPKGAESFGRMPHPEDASGS